MQFNLIQAINDSLKGKLNYPTKSEPKEKSFLAQPSTIEDQVNEHDDLGVSDEEEVDRGHYSRLEMKDFKFSDLNFVDAEQSIDPI